MTAASEQVRGNVSRAATLCFFYSPTSGPSRRVEGFLAQVLQRGRKHRTLAVQRVNCDEHPELVQRYAVTQMPTLVVIEDGRVLGRLEGFCGCREIEKLLGPWLNREAARGRLANGTGSPQRKATALRTGADDGVEVDLVRLSRNGSDRTPYTPVGLRLPARLSFERWQALGRQIGSIGNASSWWLGDWASYGEASYGEKYRHAIAVTGLDYQTLRNYAWVAGRFDVSRRRDTLSFGHHAELAALPEREQEDWLDQAEKGRWSRSVLRAHLRNEKRARLPGNVEHLRLDVETARVERWKAAADAESLALTDWLAAAADNAAHDVVAPSGSTSRSSRADGATAPVVSRSNVSRLGER
jgi:hypothetical protein